MKTDIKRTNRLPIQVGALLTDPYEWCLIDWIYWKTNTQHDRQWICRATPIQENTPIKRLETILEVLERLVIKNIGFTKEAFGKPQKRRSGKSRENVEVKQSYQYRFDAVIFDAWLKSHLEDLSENGKVSIRKRIGSYPKADRGLSESGYLSYPKTDTTIMNKKNDHKKEEKNDHKATGNIVCPSGVTPSTIQGSGASGSDYNKETVSSVSSSDMSTAAGVPSSVPHGQLPVVNSPKLDPYHAPKSDTFYGKCLVRARSCYNKDWIQTTSEEKDRIHAYVCKTYNMEMPH
jgi:hypothetical protein